MTVRDPSENDWAEESDFDCAMMAKGGAQEAADECKRRGLVWDDHESTSAGGHVRPVRRV